MPENPLSKIALLGLAISLGAIAAAMMAGFGTLLAWWDYRTGFGILSWAAGTGLVGAAVSLAGGFFATLPARRGLALAATGMVAGILAYAVPASGLNQARSVPKIHDITTDTANPPAFVASLDARKKAGARNSVVYAGDSIAAQQRRAYPDIKPVTVEDSPARLFERALTVARNAGWEILEADKQAGRIEATDTTLWFGFKDDIVIRIQAGAAGGSRLDIRSISRVGRSDAGANAARIRSYLTELSKN